MSDETVVLPTGPKIIHKSELFEVRILRKWIVEGLTRVQHLLVVELLARDPLLIERAEVEVDGPVWADLEVGETVMLRCYEHPDKTWKATPPVVR